MKNCIDLIEHVVKDMVRDMILHNWIRITRDHWHIKWLITLLNKDMIKKRVNLLV